MSAPGSVDPDESLRICVLAGGRSSRMGRDKSAIRLGRLTLLENVTARAEATGYPVAVIREDVVSACGPLGGMLTGFERHAEARLLFLSCDMPFVSDDLLAALMARTGSVFVKHGGRFGFPLQIARVDLGVIRRRHADGDYSVQGLARELAVATVSSTNPERELFNINTPDDWEQARGMIES